MSFTQNDSYLKTQSQCGKVKYGQIKEEEAGFHAFNVIAATFYEYLLAHPQINGGMHKSWFTRQSLRGL